MKLTPVDNLTVTDAIVEKIESMIVKGVFRPGDALPPERKLARELGVSRASLRQALAALEVRGLIVSRQGGGNFICDVAKESFSDPLVSLLNRHSDLKYQIIEMRMVLESAAAFFAAERATAQDRIDIKVRFEELQSIVSEHQPGREARADLDLHMAIADAAHNAALSLMIRNVYSLLLNHIEEHLSLISEQADPNQKLQHQHQEIVEAILEGDSARAKTGMQRHLEFVSDSFNSSGIVAKRQQTAEMRAYLSGG